MRQQRRAMRMRSWTSGAAGWMAWIACLGLLGAGPAHAQIGGCVPDLGDPILVDMETSLGTIPLELYPNTAPGTVQNFLDYMNAGDYDGTLIHRSVLGFVIQGGGFREESGAYALVPTDPPIANEPCLSNTRGTIAMARLGGQPNSATNQWFVNLDDNLFLDSSDGVGFTAFGRVVGDGLPVADAIGALPIFDALAILELPFNQILAELPLQNLPADPPEGYGCARDAPHFGLADETIDALIADPLRSGGFFVPVLLDPQCDGSGALGPPATPCTPGMGRDVFEGNLFLQQFFLPRIPMTCAAVAEAEESWAARRAGTLAHLLAEDVEVTRLPEPQSELLLAAGLAALYGLGRARARCAGC